MEVEQRATTYPLRAEISANVTRSLLRRLRKYGMAVDMMGRMRVES